MWARSNCQLSADVTHHRNDDLLLIILIFVSFSLPLKRSPNSVHHLARLYAKCTKSPSFVGQQTAQNACHEKRLCSQLTTALLVSVAHVGDGGEKLG